MPKTPKKSSNKSPKKSSQKHYKTIPLKKTGCCCGATLRTPCVCMITGEKCSSTGRMCSCFRLKHNQNK